MVRHWTEIEESDTENETVLFQTQQTLAVPGLSRGVMVKIGAAMAAIGMMVFVVNSTWSSQRLQASLGASISKDTLPDFQNAQTSCFEENVAYKLGKITQGKSEWMLADDKRGSAHECQLWCQSFPACEFFTFRSRTTRCTLTTNRGEKMTKGKKTISGPRVCPGAARPCEEYKISSALTLSKDWKDGFSGQLSGQNLKVDQFVSGNDGLMAWDIPQTAHDEAVNSPTWPKGMEAVHFAGVSPWTNLKITIDGDPMEDVILTLIVMLPNFPDKGDGGVQRSQWNGTLSDGTWIPVTNTFGLFRADLVDDGRTLFLEGGQWEYVMVNCRLSKPVSTVSITTSHMMHFVGLMPLMMAVSQGQKCK